MSKSMKKLSVDEINNEMRNSAFRRSSYGVDIGFNRFLHNIELFTHGLDRPISEASYSEGVLVNNPDKLFECVPAFQRDNDKWTEDMQVKFVENILRGYKTTLMFFELVANDKLPLRCEMKVLDGLQRLTAIHAFVTGKIKAFGWTYDEAMGDKRVHTSLLTIKIQAYSFESEIEAVEFYINMNENITHSSKDIDRAKKYLAKLKAEQVALKPIRA